ncbi:MAG: HAD hydrolase-like protein, partial [Polyangiaceae bacterium]|nr:HAD hydrolase-like protein [Polyangiaceae bacterium]
TVMPGAIEAVAALERLPASAIGIGTGNVRRGAEIKLHRCGLDARLTFGGFGCDARAREDLLRVGFERGASRLRARVEDCALVVIGDTPLDVGAARAVGAMSIAVCTGGHTKAELAESGASVVLADLSDESVLVASIGALMRSAEREGRIR